MKNKLTRQIIHALILLGGISLMIGGIVTGKHGATVVGIIVAGVDVTQWIHWNRKEKQTV